MKILQFKETVEKIKLCDKINLSGTGGDFLPNIRIDNLTGDKVTVFLDSHEAVIEDDGRVTFDSLEKGTHTLHVHRTRIPYESGEAESDTDSKPALFGGEEKSLHTQLDWTAEINLNSTKSVITLKTDVSSMQKGGMDAIFSSYSATISGAVIEGERKFFTNRYVRKAFVSTHLKNAFFPVGLCGCAIWLLSVVAMVFALLGKPIDVGGTMFTIPWAVALLTVATGIVGYFIFCIVKIIKKAKELEK